MGSVILILVMLVWLGFWGSLLVALFGVFFGTALLGLMLGAATVCVCACITSNGTHRR